MSAHVEVNAALSAKVESLTGVTIVWPRKGGDEPAGEYVRVAFVRADDEAPELSGDRYIRKGFIVLALVSALGQYQIVSEAKAGTIADQFSRGEVLTNGTSEARIVGASIRDAKEEDGRWVTPIWVEYWSWN